MPHIRQNPHGRKGKPVGKGEVSPCHAARYYLISFNIFLQIDFIFLLTVLSETFRAKAMFVTLFSFLRISRIIFSSSVNGQRSKNL